MILLGVTGKAGAGKDTIANAVRWTQRWHIYHFADPLKECCAAAFGLGLLHFQHQDLKEKVDPLWNMSPRQMAQFVGTELFRDILGHDFWLRRASKESQKWAANKYEGVVIADVRFQNEADWILARGGKLITVVREGLSEVGIAKHSSEAGFDTVRYGDRHEVIENKGTKEELEAKVLDYLVRNFDNIIPF